MYSYNGSNRLTFSLYEAVKFHSVQKWLNHPKSEIDSQSLGFVFYRACQFIVATYAL